ncbi:MAG: hypothetical protein Q4F05_17960, partial [bacterium]|nr:hypothetical protein [bacterium]
KPCYEEKECCKTKKPCYEEIMPSFREKRTCGYVMDDGYRMDDGYADDMDGRIAKYYGYQTNNRPMVEERYARYYDYDNDGMYDDMYEEMYRGTPYVKRAPRRMKRYVRPDDYDNMADDMTDCPCKKQCNKTCEKADVYDVDYTEYCTGMYKGCFAKPMRRSYIRTWEEDND